MLDGWESSVTNPIQLRGWGVHETKKYWEGQCSGKVTTVWDGEVAGMGEGLKMTRRIRQSLSQKFIHERETGITVTREWFATGTTQEVFC